MLEIQYKNFNYCIWLVPEMGHSWYNIISDFSPHISIKTDLQSSDISVYKYIIDTKLQIEVELIGNLYQTKTENFFAIQGNVNITNQPNPNWWPSNAHVSFKYQYNKPFTDKEIVELESMIKEKKAICTNIIVKLCNGHFSNW